MFDQFRKKDPQRRPIALLTDFGLDDPYVGQMKGVLARLAPGCPVLDISHGVLPFNVVQAGFFLAQSMRHFPRDCVFLAVVDPGVGTGRRLVAAQLGGQTLIAPDNGLLARALDAEPDAPVFDVSRAADAVADKSATFHGRDVMAPLAAWAALGGSAEDLGERLDRAGLHPAAPTRAEIAPDAIRARVLHADRFGNLILDLAEADLPDAGHVGIGGRTVAVGRTYAQAAPGDPLLLAGSQGQCELAVNQGDASRLFGLAPGDAVELSLEPEGVK